MSAMLTCNQNFICECRQHGKHSGGSMLLIVILD